VDSVPRFQGILGTLNIENSLSHGTTLFVNDSADTATHAAPLGTFTPPGDGPWASLTGLAPAAINWELFDVNSVGIVTGPHTTIH
jgi:hypothetical protein